MVNHNNAYQYTHNSVQQATLGLVPRRARRVLDLGGGSGGFTLAVAERCGAEFTATLDISEDAIAAAEEGINVAEVMDLEEDGALERFVATHGPFDLVLCLDVLEHLVDPWRVMARLHALMPDDGQVLASIPNVQNYRIAMRSLTGKWHYRDSGLFDRTHLRFFSRRSAAALMTGTGLKQMGYGRTYGPTPRDKMLSRLSMGLLDPWLTMQHIIVVQKQSPVIHDPGMFGERVAFS